MSNQGSTGNVIAAVCSFFLPGLGQLVQGNILSAFLFFVFTGFCYFLLWPLGLIPHIWSIVDAARFRPAHK